MAETKRLSDERLVEMIARNKAKSLDFRAEPGYTMIVREEQTKGGPKCFLQPLPFHSRPSPPRPALFFPNSHSLAMGVCVFVRTVPR